MAEVRHTLLLVQIIEDILPGLTERVRNERDIENLRELCTNLVEQLELLKSKVKDMIEPASRNMYVPRRQN